MYLHINCSEIRGSRHNYARIIFIYCLRFTFAPLKRNFGLLYSKYSFDPSNHLMDDRFLYHFSELFELVFRPISGTCLLLQNTEWMRAAEVRSQWITDNITEIIVGCRICD
jgi:hypothetical protein